MQKKTLETPNLPQGQTPFLQHTTQEMTRTKEISVQCPAPLSLKRQNDMGGIART